MPPPREYHHGYRVWVLQTRQNIAAFTVDPASSRRIYAAMLVQIASLMPERAVFGHIITHGLVDVVFAAKSNRRCTPREPTDRLRTAPHSIHFTARIDPCPTVQSVRGSTLAPWLRPAWGEAVRFHSSQTSRQYRVQPRLAS